MKKIVISSKYNKIAKETNATIRKYFSNTDFGLNDYKFTYKKGKAVKKRTKNVPKSSTSDKIGTVFAGIIFVLILLIILGIILSPTVGLVFLIKNFIEHRESLQTWHLFAVPWICFALTIILQCLDIHLCFKNYKIRKILIIILKHLLNFLFLVYQIFAFSTLASIENLINGIICLAANYFILVFLYWYKSHKIKEISDWCQQWIKNETSYKIVKTNKYICYRHVLLKRLKNNFFFFRQFKKNSKNVVIVQIKKEIDEIEKITKGWEISSTKILDK